MTRAFITADRHSDRADDTSSCEGTGARPCRRTAPATPPRPEMYKTDFVGDDADTWERFVEYDRTRDRDIRNDLIERHLALAESLARRYEGRGEPAADLRQVAMIGLLKAIERFDPWRGVPFASFAVPTVRGELRRHFRDTGWTVRVPRRLQELHLDLREVASDLAHRLGRSPTIPEIAEAAGVEEEAVLEGMDAARLYRVLSLDAPVGGESGGALTDLLGTSDRELAAAEAREAVRPMLDVLAERERRIVYLRFFEEKTQTEIAELVGVSQMHVSRLLESSLRLMRSSATAPPAVPSA